MAAPTGAPGAVQGAVQQHHQQQWLPPSSSSIVKLNVGGCKFTTTVGTLTSVPCSYFEALFSGRWKQHLTEDGEVFLDRDGEVFKYVLHYLRARASASDAVYLPSDDVSRHALRCEARYFALPCLESLLAAPNGSFADVYAQQSSALDDYIAAQPFQAIKQLVFDILTGSRRLASAWNPGLEQGAIMVSLLNAPVIRISFSVAIASDHVRLAPDKNRFKVALPDSLLESVYSGYYEVYMYEFGSNTDEVAALNKVLYNLGTRAVLLRLLQEQPMFDVRMVWEKRPASAAAGPGGASSHTADYELVLEFHRRRPPPTSPRLSGAGAAGPAGHTSSGGGGSSAAAAAAAAAAAGLSLNT